MPTQVQIANIALALIGARANIQNFNQATPEANAVSLFYEPEFQALARSANWNCLRKQALLTLLKAAPWTPEGQSLNLPLPPLPWSYEYGLPADNLRARFIVPWAVPQQPATTPPLTTNAPPAWPTNWGSAQAVKYVVSSDQDQNGTPIRVILTNKPQAILVYTADLQDPNLWDSMFLKAFTNTLAAFLVNPLGRNSALMKDAINVANGIIAQARMTDGDEGIKSADHLPDWMRARAAWGADGRYASNESWDWQSFDRMFWSDASLF